MPEAARDLRGGGLRESRPCIRSAAEPDRAPRARVRLRDGSSRARSEWPRGPSARRPAALRRAPRPAGARLWPAMGLGRWAPRRSAGWLRFPTYPNYDAYRRSSGPRAAPRHAPRPSTATGGADRAPADVAAGALLGARRPRTPTALLVGANARGVRRARRRPLPARGDRPSPRDRPRRRRAALHALRPAPFLALCAAYVDSPPIPRARRLGRRARDAAPAPRRARPRHLLALAGLLRPEAWLLAGVSSSPGAGPRLVARERAVLVSRSRLAAPCGWAALHRPRGGPATRCSRSPHTSGLAEELGRPPGRGPRFPPRRRSSSCAGMDKNPGRAAGRARGPVGSRLARLGPRRARVPAHAARRRIGGRFRARRAWPGCAVVFPLTCSCPRSCSCSFAGSSAAGGLDAASRPPGAGPRRAWGRLACAAAIRRPATAYMGRSTSRRGKLQRPSSTSPPRLATWRWSRCCATRPCAPPRPLAVPPSRCRKPRLVPRGALDSSARGNRPTGRSARSDRRGSGARGGAGGAGAWRSTRRAPTAFPAATASAPNRRGTVALAAPRPNRPGGDEPRTSGRTCAADGAAREPAPRLGRALCRIGARFARLIAARELLFSPRPAPRGPRGSPTSTSRAGGSRFAVGGLSPSSRGISSPLAWPRSDAGASSAFCFRRLPHLRPASGKPDQRLRRRGRRVDVSCGNRRGGSFGIITLLSRDESSSSGPGPQSGRGRPPSCSAFWFLLAGLPAARPRAIAGPPSIASTTSVFGLLGIVGRGSSSPRPARDRGS
jgi:hypothetical protein